MSSHHLLPPNATVLERALAKATSMPHTPEVLASLGDSQRCPVDLLPWLAWAMSVDEWQDDWPEARKRAAVRAAVELHRKKGTPWAVLRALAVHGFEDCEIIEYASFLHEWQASGGKYLDGSWQLSGQALSPNVPGARDVVRNAALNHWAHYAIRVNTADTLWSSSQQQRLAAVARRYAPARSHLVALIDILKASFVATPHLGASRQRIRQRFDKCTRISATGHRHLDGCWLLDADKHTPALNGSWQLTGQPMRTTYSNGLLLNSGNLHFSSAVQLRLSAQATAGERQFAPRRLGWATPRLNGSWWLDGSRRLNNQDLPDVGNREYFDKPINYLDGTWTLGSLGAGSQHIWSHARLNLRCAAKFVTPLHFGVSRQRIRLRFNKCTRLSATGHHHLDGCWQLNADKHTPTLDGRWQLAGQPLRTTYPNGVQLSSGNLHFSSSVRLRFSVPATAGKHQFAPRRLGWAPPRLNGSWRLNAVPRLDGSHSLNEHQCLGIGGFERLGSHINHLDGSWTLGSVDAQTPHIWSHGRITVRRANGHITTEAL